MEEPDPQRMTTSLETPSGKTDSTENFPVAHLISKPYRKHVEAFYIFARAADDISDNPQLSAEEKIARLDRFDTALMDPADDKIASVIPLRESLKETGVTPEHARDLLKAFKQDATKLRYETWDELLDYCRYSASPVGRYLLDLHGETREAWPANDALCSVLQIINHLQDCADDYIEMDRVYIPRDILHACGGHYDDLGLEMASPGLRAAMITMLDHMEPMMQLAQTFPPQVRDFRLRMDTAVINALAVKMINRLRYRDPLCDYVKLNKAQKLCALIQGLITAIRT